MKKLIVFTLMLSCASAYTYKPPVPGALYAEIRGVPGCLNDCWRVYKGAEAMHPVCHTIEYTCPTLCFFDKDGNELLQEKFDGEIRPHFYEIQQRLTLLPKAHHAKVVWLKAPGHPGSGLFAVLLFDKDGTQIASLECPFTMLRIPQVGDPIPEEFIDGFTDSVENPDTLESLKIIDVVEIPYEITEEEYFTKYYPRLKAYD